MQQTRAERAVAALRAMSAAEASVVRDGERRSVGVSEIVPGDLILVEEGDMIPADARLIECTSLQVQEASLTGESLPVSKSSRVIEGGAALGDRSNMVYSGTTVAYGRGRAVVTATGMRTELGRIARLIERTEEEATPLQRELDRTGRLLGLAVLAIAAVVVATILLVEGVRSPGALLEVLILGVALAVAAVPEGLPAIVTVVLAIGVRRMAARNAIVRKLPAVETLGSATVIASDKTGTLTRNEMTVRAVVTAGGRANLTGTGYAPEGELLGRDMSPLADATVRREVEQALLVTERANNAAVKERDGRWVVRGDSTEGALLVAARKAGLSSEALDERFERVGEVPFSSERKMMSVVYRDRREGGLILFAKGAPDVLLGRCSRELVGGEARPLSEERRREISLQNELLAAEALRTLGAAYRAVTNEELERGPDHRIEQNLVFVGLVGMMDPPREEARRAVAVARDAGVRTIMITGDHPRTAAAVAGQLGISTGEPALTGAELDEMTDEALRRVVRESAVYARVNPEHKLRVVRALQENGEVVAMTGDGVNDAPALKTADIGVAMGVTGTDVSREAADMVLTDDNFASIVAAIEEGRSIFANIQKFLRYLLSSNIGEVLVMFLAVLLAGVIGLSGEGFLALPLTATQILWINLLTDGAPALALGLEPAGPDAMRRPPRPRGSGVITRRAWLGIAVTGLIMAAGTLFVLDYALPGGYISGSGGLLRAQTMAFTTLVLFQIFNVFNARSFGRSAFAGLFRNPWLWGALLLSLLLQVLVVYAPFLHPAFGTVPLSLQEWGLCAAVASTVLWLREAGRLASRAQEIVPGKECLRRGRAGS
ncbi:ATPase, P-type, K/Mg/Cd/Cu/Zn/Na/Ca/Na/H-transporter [Rubrobacter xylanophilus DSM 9941]|uniref:Probable cation-transporting ATPase F n=1 Tax=Rubrobacter xylanophilus (strain DSM 9941 / JCM 11954 / NBRC 16129 / PRD-1) TaxID=266117 RepID=Q1ARJ3_RUBXD|nr:ATPase, P-type, K/Mg/Cd/Cu/Zn/Na/Ca/Na/H-transporter [Rubrobacter xylanophilus DSM 9941]